MKRCLMVVVLFIICIGAVSVFSEVVETYPAESISWSENINEKDWHWVDSDIDSTIIIDRTGDAIAYVDALRGDVISFDFFLKSEKQKDFLIITIDDIHALTISGTTTVWLNLSLAFPKDGYHKVVFHFAPEQDDGEKYVMINHVFKLTGADAKKALEVDNREFICRVELGMCQIYASMRFMVPELQYRILCYDQYDKPVAGAMINVCNDTSCRLMTTDEDGAINVTMPTYPYEFHVLRVPSGYSCDSTQVLTIDEMESYVVLHVQKD